MLFMHNNRYLPNITGYGNQFYAVSDIETQSLKCTSQLLSVKSFAKIKFKDHKFTLTEEGKVAGYQVLGHSYVTADLLSK